MTVVEFLDRITPGMDDEIAKTFQRTLKKQGIKFQLKTKVMGAAVKGDKAVLTTEPVKGGDQTEMEADVVLVSTGRIPFTDGLGLENVGIKVSARGQVEVDDHFATNVAGVYAIGDVVRGAMLAHKAEEEGIAVIEHIAGKGGHVEVMEWARAEDCPWDVWTCEFAAEGGHLEVLKWARENGCPLDEQTCHYAAGGGHLDILKWARANGAPWDEVTCAFAAEAGHLEVLKWARENNCPWDEDTREIAAEMGYVES